MEQNIFRIKPFLYEPFPFAKIELNEEKQEEEVIIQRVETHFVVTPEVLKPPVKITKKQIVRPDEKKAPKVAIYSVNFGGYDEHQLTHVKQTYPCDFFFYTYDKWKLLPDGKCDYDKSKIYRMHPEKIPDLEPYDIAIYIDGNVQIMDKNFVMNLFKNKDLFEYDLIMTEHPTRNCVYDEITASIVIPKYKSTNLAAYAQEYKAQGYPKHNGLYWCGFIIHIMKNANKPKLVEFKSEWWKEMNRYAPKGYCQDQVAFPVVYHNMKKPFNLKVLPAQHGKNKWFKLSYHKK